MVESLLCRTSGSITTRRGSSGTFKYYSPIKTSFGHLVIFFSFIQIFFIWWCYTEKKYGPISIPVDEEGRPYLYSRHGRIRSASTTALPEMVIHHPNRRASTSTGFPKCSKPACVCAVPQKSEVGRGNKWRQWRNTIKNEDTEVYGPANKV